MKISHRLYLTVTPAIIGVFLAVGLAYWGQYGNTAPVIVVVLGAVGVLASLGLTWSNARYIARRIERLAGTATTSTGAITSRDGERLAADSENPDEIGEIERAVNRLSSAVERAESSAVTREQRYARRVQDYALLLASIADASTHRLEEVRLPLHILLENHFGDLNENQEEMLGAARSAAEAADADMLSLRQIAAMDLDEQPMRADRIKPSELIDALLPMLLATAEASGVTLEFDVAPVLPSLLGDRVRLQDAFVTLLKEGVASAKPDTPLHITVDREGDTIRLVMHGAGVGAPTVRWAAAARVVQAHDGAVERVADGLSVELPTETGKRVMPS